MDHLLAPKDLVDTMRRLSLGTRLLVRAMVVYPLTVLQGLVAYLPIRGRDLSNDTSISIVPSSFQSL
jgi:hypothetical protein